MISYFRKPNFVFFGTPKLAAVVLEELLKADFIPQAVVSNPDRPQGRKHILTPPPTKLLAQKYNVPVLQPENVMEIKDALENIKPDIFIIAAYSKILPKEILAIPKLGPIGVHPSLLPKYRGSSPVQCTILNGEKETGTTLFVLDEKVDHGPVIAQRNIPAGNLAYEELSRALMKLGGELLVEVMPEFLAGRITPKPQDESSATYTKKFTGQDGYIPLDIFKKAENGGAEMLEVERKIRALNPEPGVYTVRDDGKRVKLLEAELINGKLRLIKIQVEGKLPQSLR